VVISVPDLPIMLAIAASVPLDWPVERVYFIITILIALRSWTGLARVVRGKFLSLREDDFILAARLDGAPQGRLVLRHMLPSSYSHIIASLTLSLPGMILAETALMENAAKHGIIVGAGQALPRATQASPLQKHAACPDALSLPWRAADVRLRARFGRSHVDRSWTGWNALRKWRILERWRLWHAALG
jgi:hypothetical protein